MDIALITWVYHDSAYIFVIFALLPETKFIRPLTHYVNIGQNFMRCNNFGLTVKPENLLYQDPAPLIMRRRNANCYHSINSIVMSVECLKLEFIRVIKRKKSAISPFLPINGTRLIRVVVDSVDWNHWNCSQILEYFVVSLAVTISHWC